jgi:hypothetical protein
MMYVAEVAVSSQINIKHKNTAQAECTGSSKNMDGI